MVVLYFRENSHKKETGNLNYPETTEMVTIKFFRKAGFPEIADRE